MQIHEITKRQRTDEGLLDGVKDAITTAKNTAVNAVSHPVNLGAYQQSQNSSALAQANAIRQKLNAKYGLTGTDNEVKASVRGANQPGKLSLDQKLELAKRDPKAKQKIAQLVKAFDQEFDTGPDVQYQTNPDAAEKAVQQKTVSKVQPVQPVQPNATTQPYSAQTQQNVSAQNKQMSPQSGIKEGALAQRSQARNAGIAQTPAPAKQAPAASGASAFGQIANQLTKKPVAKKTQTGAKAFGQMANQLSRPAVNKSATQNPAAGKKNIQKDFQAWITQQIPGIEDVSPDVKQKLDQSFQAILQAKGNSKAADAAFEEYATLALASTNAGLETNTSANSSTQQQAANRLGISPDAIAKLQQRIALNREQIKTTDTGSPTINTLIQAVTGK